MFYDKQMANEAGITHAVAGLRQIPFPSSIYNYAHSR